MKATQGVITKGIGGFYYVAKEGHIYETRACGRFRKEHILPYVGDRVELSQNCDSIVDILPRKSVFIRPPVANIDRMVIVASVASPAADTFMIDALLLAVEHVGIDAAICINKSDLSMQDECEELREMYEKAGYPAVITSARSPSGGAALLPLLENRITAFAGNSGVGKSSLLNLIGDNLGLETGAISEKTARGKHTTRHVELFPLRCGGYVLDTPGFSRMDLPSIAPEGLDALYREFAPLANTCRYTGCAHLAEPDCAVKAAVEEGKIAQKRYDSYSYFYEKLKHTKLYERNGQNND